MVGRGGLTRGAAAPVKVPGDTSTGGVGISSSRGGGTGRGGRWGGMPITTDSFVRLTDHADQLAAHGGGRLATDAAQFAARAREAMGERQAIRLGALMRRAQFQSPEIAELIRSGALEIVESDIRGWTCDRCNREAEPGTSLCADCRRYLGWARLTGGADEPPPPPPEVVQPRLVARPRTVTPSQRRPGGMRRIGDRDR